jgi:DNA invertase Pin-like site-specific DNA recombinase
MAHLLGYARISTGEQHPDLQVDALKAAGCYRVFVDTASGALTARPALDQVLDQLRPGDTLVVWKLDRLGRSLRHLVDTIATLADRGVGFRSLQEQVDTTTEATVVAIIGDYNFQFMIEELDVGAQFILKYIQGVTCSTHARCSPATAQPTDILLARPLTFS